MKEKFTEILNKVKPDILENPGVDLIEEGILDSLDIMNLIAEFEKAFGIDFDPDDVIPETFASAEAIWEVVQKYEKEKQNGEG